MASKDGRTPSYGNRPDFGVRSIVFKPADELIPRVVLKAAHIRVLLQSTVIGSRIGFIVTSVYVKLPWPVLLKNCFLTAEVEQYLLIQNDGETSLKVNVIVSDTKYKEIQVPEHHAKKVNISDFPGNSMIILDAGNGKCIVHELELAEHDSSPTNDLEAAEGWDQGWDDDWDESKPANRSSSDMKANGINSKTSDRNGWENDWDD
ncbi:uncharacterized protein E6C27_scaffold60G004830 [Cucumis melo var. makuwa]|uniref:DUF7356 domain-containing protein n=1 Tax=Cucumis melo var. makuwa TaxID=1194695 RepID=A0A5A7UES1_CUCMM|nr:uncharacterized protein E6C27_scaffold60G004830 [Cucumis melo var. makuwa]